jgi:hypothetical protein
MEIPEAAARYVELDRSDEEYNAALAALLSQMKGGRPAVMDLVRLLCAAELTHSDTFCAEKVVDGCRAVALLLRCSGFPFF